jgi:predicted enzyme related to lactoylglutathione lyase
MSQSTSPISMGAICIDSDNSSRLADFYAKLLGWKKFFDSEDGAAIRSPEGQIIGFQTVDDYIPPVWPWEAGRQGQMMHLDLNAENVDQAAAFAMECGATMAGTQYYGDVAKTMMDPAGHPFCICPMG